MTGIKSRIAYPILPHILRKKLDKTREARGGKGIYKRRNSRNYRVIMSYSTFDKLSKQGPGALNKYVNGYAVRIQPRQYFEGNLENDERIELGKNAFLYYKSIKDYREYPPKESWQQVAELYTSGDKNKKDPEWIGEFAAFIQNTKPKITSHICGDKNNEFQGIKKKEHLESLKSKYRPYENKIPDQAGLGNFDYDYCSKEEENRVILQLSYLLMSVPGMDEQLITYYKEFKEEAKFQENTISLIDSEGSELYKEKYKEVLQELKMACEENGVLDFEKLKKVRAISQSDENLPICPLCLETLEASDFLEIADQVEGREEEDNTRSKIALMHIDALRPGEFNHKTYNLAWGHRMCNTIQEDMSLEETLTKIEKILENNINRQDQKDILLEQKKEK